MFDVTLADSFPPYDMMRAWSERGDEKLRKLERLYHQTQTHGWDPRAVLDELVAKHGPIRLPDDKKEAVGHLFSVLVWGELAAWIIAADLALHLPDLDARMAATGQAFDEARHFTVLRDYFVRAGVELPPLNPYGKRLLRKILSTGSVLEKLYGMQLLVETLALAIFKQLQASQVEPVLSELLQYIERDEARHVALGVMYLPKLLAKTTPYERARNWVFNVELFLLTVAGGELLDPHFQTMGLDHRELGESSMKLHLQVMRSMLDELGLPPGSKIRGLYGLTREQQQSLNDFLHPADPAAVTPRRRAARQALGDVVRAAARLLH